MGSVDFEFTPPPEAPVFEPTEEEFKDPLAFIAKIRPIGERAGICRIKPPPHWQPPFAVDVDNFKFTPRIQRLNELEAKTRIKLNFLDKIAKFWELQGSSLKIPTVERKALDLHTLHMVVQKEGGFELITHERKWSRVAAEMGYPYGRSCGSLLRGHYERILYPYEIFKSGSHPRVHIPDDVRDCNKKDKDYVPHGIPSRQAIKPPVERHSRRSKRQASALDSSEVEECCDVIDPEGEKDDSVDYSANSELRKLQFYGAGPKMPGYSAKSEDDDSIVLDSEDATTAPVKETPSAAPYFDPIDRIVCHVCARGDAEESMLLCDGCDDSYHTFCLLPPLNEIPKGDWRCPCCVAKECYKPQESFGFEQATKEYTLQSFGEMADQFKSDYFNMPVHMVPTSTVEKEFWRIVGAIDEDVTVQYGADLHTMEHGSGFPTKSSKNLMPGDEEYANSGWNLNILPVLEGSVLCHINADISGMKVPWMYVGMCFATFCWHNEDHWSYSINYLHWGEPKTWYGVPGAKAALFEKAMRTAAPELFDAQPDLLHQLVTIMNPNILMKAGVPVYRTNQCAGEFVVTFPRAYHAGFNQGYNFAEAVNFCPSDWLSHGRHCIEHYSHHHRFCVFSHDELICKMASDPDSLDLHLAAATYQDMLCMVETEMKLRKSLMEQGIVVAEREAFELLPDDERQCDNCKTTCFLSAVTCSCTTKLVCIKHAQCLCSCQLDKHCLRFRYTMDELPVMLHRLKCRAESFDNWTLKAKNCLEAKPGSKVDLSELKDLIKEAEEKRFPESDLLKELVTAMQEAEKCASVAQQLVSKKVCTRNRKSVEGKFVARITLQDLESFLSQVDKLTCEIHETNLVKDLLQNVKQFQEQAAAALTSDSPNQKHLERLLDNGNSFNIDLPEIQSLTQKLQQVTWLDEVKASLSEPSRVTADVLKALLESGLNLPPHSTVEAKMAELQELQSQVERWEEKAKICLLAKPHHVMSTLEAIVNEAQNIPAYLPNTLALKDAMRKAKEWNMKVENVHNGEHFPYLTVLENLLNKGRTVPVRLDYLPQIESQVAAARSWRERTARVFMKKNCPHSLTKVLSPRTDIGVYPNSKVRRKKSKDVSEDGKERENDVAEIRMDINQDPITIVNSFKVAEQREVEVMQQFRIKNLQKRALNVGDARYCVCRKGMTDAMLQCELCKDWFHSTCVTLPKSATLRNKAGQAVVTHMSRDIKFLCPMCLRSRRPRLETILSILVSLQKLHVRMPEGEALQCLTERAMGWQDRARQSLATDELSSALAKLSVFSQRMVEQAAREKAEKIITSEMSKITSGDGLSQLELQERISLDEMADLESNTEDKCDEQDSLETKIDVLVEGNGMMNDETDDQHNEKLASSIDPESQQAFSTSEHAYSTASKTSFGQAPRKHSRKSPLVPRQYETPVLELSPMSITQLEELMMEGDLLEVYLDETQHIWRILQSCKPQREDYFPDFEGMENNGNSQATKNKLFQKRKLVDASIVRKLKRLKTKLKVDKKINVKKEPTETLITEGSVSVKVLKSKDGNRHPLLKIRKKKSGIDKEKDKMSLNAASGSGGISSCDIQVQMNSALASEKNADRRRLKNKKQDVLPEDDVEERCAASKCLKPTGEVNWVQCDGGCELWFHLVCIGLNAGDVSETEDYICLLCGRQKTMEVDSGHKFDGEKQLHNAVQGSMVPTVSRFSPDLIHVKREVFYDSDSHVDITKETFHDGCYEVLKIS